MKTILQNLVLILVLAAGSAHATVTASLTPDTVSNTYTGPITFTISGLNPGDPVVVQKFLDANTNGVIDSHDMLVQQFSLTDGQPGMVIGGVTNFNVPGDLDTTAGQITARVPFPDGDVAQTFVGQYLFKLSSPGGAITNVFTVTNLPYAQAFAGSVVNNGTNVPNAVVILFPPMQSSSHGPGNPVAATVANSLGNYTLPAPAGSYVPVAVGANFVSDLGASPLLTLTNGTTFTTNLTLINATSSISGQIVDANNPAIALPGLFLPISSNPGLLSFCASDTNGNFTAAVTSGTWKLEGEPPGLILHGYMGYQGGTNLNAGTTGFVGAFAKANALFYGRVADASGNPLTGIDISVSDNNGEYQSDVYSFTNGKYAVGVLGGLSGDTWTLQADSGSGNSNPTSYVFSQPMFDQNGGTNLNVGQAVLVNFTALLATNYLAGNVQHDGTNLPGVGVSATATINGLNYNVYADTDTNGNYSFNVANGSWNVSLNQNGGNDSLDTLLGAGSYTYPSSQSVGINNNNGIANFTIQPPTPLEITTTNLPDGTVGISYSQTLQASGGNPPYFWMLPNGTASLPPGSSGDMSFSTNGVISGTPGTPGTYTFPVAVSVNNPYEIVTQQVSLTINAAVSSLQITTTNLPDATQNAYYSTNLAATGGTPPYSWTLSPGSASLPTGLTLSTNGVISGTPGGSGTSQFIVVATDSTAAWAYQILSLTVAASTNAPVIELSAPTETSNGQFQFSFPIVSGVTYTIQSSTDLKNWSDYETFSFNNNSGNSGGQQIVTLPVAGSGDLFYRVKVGP